MWKTHKFEKDYFSISNKVIKTDLSSVENDGIMKSFSGTLPKTIPRTVSANFLQFEVGSKKKREVYL